MKKIIPPIRHDDQGEAVANLHQALDALGFPIQSEEEMQNRQYGRYTARAVKRFKVRYRLADQEPTRIDTEAAEKINALLAERGLLDEEEAGRFVVRGAVRRDGRPYARGLVRAFDKDMRSEELLGEATTDREGRYEIRYTAARFARAEKLHADLRVGVFDARGRELASSPTLFNAGPIAIIDLDIDAQGQGRSEYERYVVDLTPIRQDVPLEELTVDDLDFLRAETGIDPQHLVYLRTAARHAAQTDLPTELFYGLLRQDLPEDLAALVVTREETLRDALAASLGQHIIPARLEDDIDALLRRLQALNTEQPGFLMEPAVLFAAPADGNLDREHADFIARRLNERFRREVLDAFPPVSADLRRAMQAAVLHLDYRKYPEADLATVIRSGLLPYVRRHHDLANEIVAIERHLSERATSTVREALRLETPVKEHPAFEADLRRARTFEYARLARLNEQTARRLAATEVPLRDVDDTTLDAWGEAGILNEQQKADLRRTVELARLTDESLPLVEVLQQQHPSSPFTLAALDTEAWTALIEEHDVPLPRGETAKQYASTLRFNLERTYPSQALLTRLLSHRQAPRLRHLDALQPLLETNGHLIEGTTPAAIDWEAIEADRREQLQEQLQDLTAFANTYRALGLSAVINDTSLSADQKKETITTRVQHLDTFYRHNEEVDLRLVDFFDPKDDSLSWDGIPETDRPAVRKQVMAYQRMLYLADDTATRETLLGKGYDAAIAIAAQSERAFTQTSGLDLGIAKQVYARSQESATSASHATEVVREAARGTFKDLAVSNHHAPWVNDLLEIDGFADLFGSQDFCACAHCRSIFSPAAYFVDLMHFVEQHVSEPVFIQAGQTDHPLYLKRRRGDLWTLPLTCENTHTLLPYLTIVNEVLEHYLGAVTGSDIYATLNDPDEKISFGLPFALPLEETRLYLQHFGITLHDVYRLMQAPEEKVWQARLHCSREELDVITTPDPTDVGHRYGDPSAAMLAHFPVQDFIRVVGISREQLDALLALRYHPDLQPIKIIREAEEVQRFREVLNHLTADRLDFIHRFVRLWKKTGWTIPELDLLLMALHDAGAVGPTLNADVVRLLAQLTALQESLLLSVDELCAMVHDLPVSDAYPLPASRQADHRLYERLFDLEKLFGEKDPTTHELHTTTTFHHFSLNTVDATDQEIDPKTPVLLGGLGVSETELLLLFDLLKDEMPFDAQGDTTLDRSKLSLLYRHARLARVLGLKIDAFIGALRLNFSPAGEVVATLAQIQALQAFRQWLHAAPFSIAELRFILHGKESAGITYRTTLETVGVLVQAVQAIQPSDPVQALQVQLAQTLNLSRQQLDDALQWISADLNSAEIQTALATPFTDGVPDQPGDLIPLRDLIRELERRLLLFANLQLKEATLAYITATPAAFGIANLAGLTLGDLQALTLFMEQITSGDEAEATLPAILEDLADGSFSDGSIEQMAVLREADESLVESLVQALPLPLVPIQAVLMLSEALEWCRTLGINGYSLRKLAADDTFDDLLAARDVALGAFSSTYEDEQTRQEKLEPYRDQINVLKRDALCDYIIARKSAFKFKDRSDIYAYFLLDVEMSGCFRISRVVAAISSLQLYVHRCRVNLEQSDPDLNPNIADVHVDPARIPADEWAWRKNYRVWEANRKVFLYPENYLEPDLRDNKTPLFEELEEELLQEKITMASAEAAYKKYLAQFAALARLRIAGSYYHDASKAKDSKKALAVRDDPGYNYQKYTDASTYYFFARTAQDPPQYYYRKWERQKVWTPWEKIELAINSDYVAALLHHGKLYLFWVDVTGTEVVEIQDGTSESKGYDAKIDLLYSYQDERGTWIAPQRLPGLAATNPVDFSQYEFPPFIEKPQTHRCYPYSHNGAIGLHYWDTKTLITLKIDLFHNQLRPTGNPLALGLRSAPRIYTIGATQAGLRIASLNMDYEIEWDTDEYYAYDTPPIVSSAFSLSTIQPSLRLVLSDYAHFGDFILTLGDQQYLVKRGGALVHRYMVQVSTSLADDLGAVLFSNGLEAFLALKTQQKKEKPLGITLTNYYQLSPPYIDPDHINFRGAYGTYYRELFFHNPFLIARHLNANQKFAEAKWWYERIFDPTASESPDDEKPTDRNWRYVEFRDVTLQTMKDILTDESAIAQYKKDPFNPHAIARLRMSAYQKAIVMQYIDNLLDWGDFLFAQDTMESINEATMLYVLASDILGKRPVRLGSCETSADHTLTYERLGPAINRGSEFLIALENWNGRFVAPLAKGAGHAKQARLYRVAPYREAALQKKRYEATLDRAKTWRPAPRDPGFSLTEHTLAFCVPPNADLLAYWDRVEDRLFKIRHCMNISGVRRQLALFQPPIDPMLLVRARAAGLTLEEILDAQAAPLPPYRFSYLIEKAKQVAQTVQSFGSALLSALEKKDVEELTLLRSVHERNLLQLTRAVKRSQVQEAQRQRLSLQAAETNVQNRIDHYQELIDTGLTEWEITQQVSRHTATALKMAESIVHLQAAITYLIPQAGSPFAMKYGGKELGDSGVEFALWTSAMAGIAEAISSSAGLEASFQRREQEWEHQKTLAEQEKKQVEHQRLAAELRAAMAERDLEIHQRSMEQAEELDAFYKNKFSALGLYTYYSTTLNRLYRQAYNVALDLARMAERTYQFERDDDTVFVAGDNWAYDHAGLLAGERLLLQLQRMEHAYLTTHRRDQEITQSFSLALADPEALTKLRQKGNCTFKLDELLFDLAYPGHYRRLMKSVRLSIPCVTGPYTNVSARLTLLDSWVRGADNLSTTPLDVNDAVSIAKNNTISASSGQNDPGLFELNFRDERYLPFEGAGAVSEWRLELPEKVRLFDYDTITDVLVHVSYTAKDDAAFKATVEEQLVSALTSPDLYRLISLRHEFPTAFHRLLHAGGTAQATAFEVTHRHFPHFLIDYKLDLVSEVKVWLKPKRGALIDMSGLSLQVNENTPINGWKLHMDLEEGLFPPPEPPSPIRQWTIKAEGELDSVDDVLILMQYKASKESS